MENHHFPWKTNTTAVFYSSKCIDLGFSVRGTENDLSRFPKSEVKLGSGAHAPNIESIDPVSNFLDQNQKTKFFVIFICHFLIYGMTNAIDKNIVAQSKPDFGFRWT